MNASVEPLGVSAKRRIDALATGECDAATFLKEMRPRFQFESDESWEILSWLDQYYRRGKITADTYKTIKTGLAEIALGPSDAFQTPTNYAETEPRVRPEPIREPLRETRSAPEAKAPPRPIPEVKTPAPDVMARPEPKPEIRIPEPKPEARTRAPDPLPVQPAPEVRTRAPEPIPVQPPPEARMRAPEPIPVQAPQQVRAPQPRPVPRAPEVRGPEPRTTNARETPPAPTGPEPEIKLESRAPEMPKPVPVQVEVAKPAQATAPSIPLSVYGDEPEPAWHAEPPTLVEPAEYRSDVSRELGHGDVLCGRYRIDNLMGMSGRATLFDGIDTHRMDMPPTGQSISIKVLQGPGARNPDGVLGLRREFQTLQGLSHPNIVRVYDLDRDGDLNFYTFEPLNASPLSRILAHRTGPLARSYALAVIRDVSAALSYAHARGVVHGNLHTGSVLITARGEVRVIEFAQPNNHSQEPHLGEDDTFAPAYARAFASCQVLEGNRPSVQDDLYSLACLSYLLLTGRMPFKAGSAIEARSLRERPKRPSQLTAIQWQTLRQALKFDRADRPMDVAQFIEPLPLSEAAPSLFSPQDLAATPIFGSRLPWRGIAATLSVLALAGFGYWLFQNNEEVLSQLGTTPVEAPAVDEPPAAVKPPPAKSKSTHAPSAQSTQTAVNAPSPKQSPPAHTAANAPLAANVAATSTAAPTPPPTSASTSPSTTASMPPSTVAANPVPTPAPTSQVSTSAALNKPSAPVRSGASGSASAPVASSVPTASSSSRVELALDTVEVQPGALTAQVLVHRRGSLRGDAPFSWWTEVGTAKPGADFTSVAPRTGLFADGSPNATLTITLSGAPHAREKSFYVVIDQKEGGATVSGRTLSQVTLVNNN